jgi:syntaxin 1B/2/3
MNDRLKDLNYFNAEEEEFRSTVNRDDDLKKSDKKKQKKGGNDSDSEDEEMKQDDSVMGKEMQEYYNQIKSIRAEIEEIKNNIKKLQKVYTVILNATEGKEMQKNKNIVNEKINETSVIIKKCQKMMKDMKQRTEELKEEERKSNGSGYHAVIRIREQQHAQITREFMDVMQEYQDIQEEYKNNYQYRMKRSIMVANPDAPDEQVQAMLENPKFQPSDVFKADMLAETDRHTLDTMYAQVSETHKDILKLEVSLRELHQLFVDFAALVEQQDELFDNIEYNVMHAKEYINEGIKNLKKAKKWEKRSRKCLIM